MRESSNVILPKGVEEPDENPVLKMAREGAKKTADMNAAREAEEAKEAARYASGDVFTEQTVEQAEWKNEAPETTEEKMSREREEYDGITKEIEDLNEAVQKSTYTTGEFQKKFGLQFGKDKAATEEWIENRVKELEGKLRPKEAQTAFETGEEFSKQYLEENPLEGDVEAESKKDVQSEASALEAMKATKEGEHLFELRSDVISRVNTFDELAHVVQSFGEIPSGSSGDMFPAEYVLAAIEAVRQNPENEEMYKQITRTFGIREKAVSLAKKEAREGSEGEMREGSIGKENADILRESYERNKEKKGKWGFLKERLKGLVTFGYWEVHQAEKFRSVTGEVAQRAEDIAPLLNQTRDLDIEEAREEADHIRRKLGGGEMSREAIDAASKEIDQEKEAQNRDRIDGVIGESKKKLEEKLEGYKNRFGQAIVSESKLKEFEDSLKNALLESTIGKGKRAENIEKSDVDFKKEIRKHLDEKYWKRYVYAALEAPLAFAGFKLLLGAGLDQLASISSGTENLSVTGSEQALPGTGNETYIGDELPLGSGSEQTISSTGSESSLGSGSGLESGGMEQMKDSIWNTAKEWLEQQGISNPTNQELLDISKQVAGDNGIGVKEWGIDGTTMDTSMKQGHLLNFKGANTVLEVIKAARGL